MLSEPPAASKLRPGSRLGRYELLRPVADGGMASVWLARMDAMHGFAKLVALKTILPRFAQDPAFREMFLDEARLASRIEHENVAKVLDLGEHDGALFLSMEWVDGDPLGKVFRTFAGKNIDLPLAFLLRIVADASGGLHTAHELADEVTGNPLGVVHRDVSPQNILVNSRGIAKVIDFGIAKAKNRITKDTESGILKGKLVYMAPEQACGAPVDRRADVWALGAILYRFLAGRPPFQGENDMATLRLLTSGEAPEPLPATIHPALRRLVACALSPARTDRFSSAAEMQDELERVMRAADAQMSTHDIQTFIETHLPDQTSSRRMAIASALRASADMRPAEDPIETVSIKVGVFDSPPMTASALVAPRVPRFAPGALPQRARRGRAFAAFGGVALLAVLISGGYAVAGGAAVATRMNALGGATRTAASSRSPRAIAPRRETVVFVRTHFASIASTASSGPEAAGAPPPSPWAPTPRAAQPAAFAPSPAPSPSADTKGATWDSDGL